MRYIILGLFFLITTTITAQKINNGIGDTIHAIHYDIILNEINTNNQTIEGITRITLTPLVDALQTIPLQLKDLDVDLVTIDNESHSFTHENEILRIQLPEPIDTDDTITMEITYNGKPFHESWGGFHFSGDYAFNLGVGFESIPHNLGKTWFPCIDDFTDRATYDFFVTVENSKKAICGGTLIDTTDGWKWIRKPGIGKWHIPFQLTLRQLRLVIIFCMLMNILVWKIPYQYKFMSVPYK